MHLDVANGSIPLSKLLTSASTHASQVLIPLAYTSHGCVFSLYDQMDEAYHFPQLHQVNRELGHRLLIGTNSCRHQALARH